MKTSTTRRLRRAAILSFLLCTGLASAEWTQNASVGPFLYTDTGNWNGGTIDNLFSVNPTTNLNVTFDADYTLTSALTLSYAGSQNITFRSDTATARTIKMVGNWTKSAGGGTITLGTSANPLILDLNGATRTFGAVSSGSASFVINAKITNSGAAGAGINLNGGTGYTYLYNNTSDFDGPVSFTRRGGSFSSIKDVNGGASSLGAPTTAARGLITVADITSFGSLDYTGSGDSSNRNWQWNLTGGSYALRNNGGGKLSLSGTFSFNGTNAGVGIEANSGDIDITGVISESGAAKRAINFIGASMDTRTITLGAANTYTGKTTISGITLVASALKNTGTTSSLGDATAADAVIGIGSSTKGGRLRYTGTGDTTNRPVDLAGTTGGAVIENNGLSGALVFTSDFTASGVGAKTLTLAGSNTGANAIQGVIVDNAPANPTALAKTGNGTWIVSGANTFTGATTVTGGTLDLGGGTANGSLAATVLNLGGGTFAYTRSGGTTQTFTTTNILPGASAITSVAGNTLNLGALNPVSGGTVDIGFNGSITTTTPSVNGIIGGWATYNNGTTWAVSQASGDPVVPITGLSTYLQTSMAGTISVDYTGNNIDVDDNAGTLDGVISATSLRFSTPGANTITLADGTSTITSGGILVTSDVGDNLSKITGGTLAVGTGASLVVNQNNGLNSLRIESTIADNTGATALVKLGAGTLSLTGANTHSGATIVVGGTLVLENSLALQLSALDATNSIAGTAAAGLKTTLGTLTIGGLLGSKDIAALFTTTAGGYGGVTALTLNPGTGATLTYDGSIADGATGMSVIKSGSGTQVLAGACGYTGATDVRSGTLQLTGSLSASTTLNLGLGADSGTFILGNAGAARNQTISGLTTTGTGGSNRIAGGGNATASILTVDLATGTNAFGGIIGGSGTNQNRVALTKTGTGTLTLSGTNTYTGGTILSAGTIIATSGAALGTGGLVNNATLDLANTGASYTLGTVTGNGTINATLGTGSTTAKLPNSVNLAGFTGTINVGVSQAAGSAKLALEMTAGPLPAGATVNITANSTLFIPAAATHHAPITLFGGNTGESLGQLRLESNANWAGNITLAGAIDSADNTIGNAAVATNSATISGNIGESGGPRDLSKGGTGIIVLAGINTYTGNTRINAGTLTLADNARLTFKIQDGGANNVTGAGVFLVNGDFAIDTSAVTVASGSWQLENVPMLTGAYGGTFQVVDPTGAAWTNAGNDKWTKPASPGNQWTFDETTGTLKLAAIGGYADWAGTNAPSGTIADDFDNDGVPNGVEYVLGGDKNTNDLDKLPALATDGTNMTFTFVRDQASIGTDITLAIEVGTTLAGWPVSYAVGADSAGSAPQVMVQQDVPLAGQDTITLTLPMAPDPAKFARLKVDQTTPAP